MNDEKLLETLVDLLYRVQEIHDQLEEIKREIKTLKSSVLLVPLAPPSSLSIEDIEEGKDGRKI